MAFPAEELNKVCNYTKHHRTMWAWRTMMLLVVMAASTHTTTRVLPTVSGFAVSSAATTMTTTTTRPSLSSTAFVASSLRVRPSTTRSLRSLTMIHHGKGGHPKLPVQDAEVISTNQEDNDIHTTRSTQKKLLDTRTQPSRTTMTQPTPVLYSAWRKIQPAAAIATVALAVTMSLSLSDPAWAAMSGGRMGGSFGSSGRSMPSSRSYGGGGGYGGGGAGRTTYYNRPSVTILPSVPYYGGGFGFGYSPFITPSPYAYGGPGVLAVSRGPSFLDILLFGGMALFIANAVRNTFQQNELTQSGTGGGGFWDTFSNSNDVRSALGIGTSVAQISVALEVSNRDDRNSILSVLDRLAQTARTDSRVGVQQLTSQVALELLRRKSTIVSASSSYDHYRDLGKAQREYSTKSIQERSKFEKEGVSKYGGVDYTAAEDEYGIVASGVNSKATMAVVTILLAIEGDHTKIPTRISSVKDVETALHLIASDARVDDCLLSAEILWTPEDRSETLTMREVLADYPELRSI